MKFDDIQDTPDGATLTMRVHLENGLHARPAAHLAQEAQNFISEITLESDFGTADASSMLDILSLALQNGSDVSITAKGPDAREAVTAVATFLSGEGD